MGICASVDPEAKHKRRGGEGGCTSLHIIRPIHTHSPSPTNTPQPTKPSDNHITDAGVIALAALLGEGIAPPATAAATAAAAAAATTAAGGADGGGEVVEGGQCPLLQDLHLGYNDVGPAGA
jgi:hypothetical protein